MRQAHGTAVAAGRQATGLQEIVRSAAIATSLGNFTLWKRGHDKFSLLKYRGKPDFILQTSGLIIVVLTSDVKPKTL